jgi:hypothetical protein
VDNRSQDIGLAQDFKNSGFTGLPTCLQGTYALVQAGIFKPVMNQ